MFELLSSKKIKIFAISGFIFCSVFSTTRTYGFFGIDSSFLDLDKFTVKVESALSVKNKIKSVPASSFFGENQKTLTDKYNILLNDCVATLSNSELNEQRNSYLKLGIKYSELEKEKEKILTELPSAPFSTWIPWKSDRKGLEKKLNDIKDEQKTISNSMSELKIHISEYLTKSGVGVSEGEIDILLSNLGGADLTKIISVLENLKKISSNMKKILESNEGSISLSVRYAGLHMIMTDIFKKVHEDAVFKIETVYEPGASKIIDKTKELIADANMMIRNNSNDSSLKILETNNKINQKTLRTTNMYMDYLARRKKDILNNILKLNKELEIAENTYATLSTGKSLVDLIGKSFKEIDSIFSFSLPDLGPEYGIEFFKEITTVDDYMQKVLSSD